MSARIRSIKSNITKNKNKQNFSKTVTSNFMKSSEKSPKTNKEFCITKSTRFSDNNLTDTIASSIRTISKLKSRKKEKPIFINLDDFHKQFLLNKNKDNNAITSIYTKKRYNTLFNNIIKSNYIQNINSPKNNVIKLKKKSASPSFFSSSTSVKSRNLLYTNKKIKEYNSNSIFCSIYENKRKNKILLLKDYSKISKNNTNNNNTNSISNNYSNENIKNNYFSNIFISPNKLKEFEPILKPKKLKNDSLSKLNINSNINRFGYNNNNNNNNSNFNNISNSNQNSMTEKESKNNIKNLSYYIGRNTTRLNEQLAYPSFNSQLFGRANRKENIDQFLYKTKLMALDKYLKNVRKNTYMKILTRKENILDNQILYQRSIELKKKLFFSYNKTLEEYLRFLLRKYREIKEENESLKKNILEINNDIEIIKQRFTKGINLIKEGYSIKFFLMCVKNHTLSLEKFEEDDIEEIENDKLKLKDNYYLTYKKAQKMERNINRTNTILINNKLRRTYTSQKTIINFRKNIFIKSDNDNDNDNNEKKIEINNSSKSLLGKITKNTPPTLFNSIEEFFDNLKAIASKLNLLIKEYNDKIANNIYLKLELQSIAKKTEGHRKDSIILNNKIKLYERNLENLKIKNKILSEQLYNHKEYKFKNDVKILLVLKNIFNIYANIKKEYIISNINKEDIITYGKQIYLKIIEDFLLKIRSKVLEDKNKYPIEYEKLKQQLEKRKKVDAFIIFQRLLAQKIQIKIDNVLKKASKIIYRRLRKTNDYREYLKKKLAKKKEKKKNDMELFLELLDDSDD